MDIFIEIVGYIGAFLISVAFLPQTYKLIKTKDTKGLSVTCYLIYHLGLTFFIVYASFNANYPLLVANVFGWAVNFVLLFLIFSSIYQNKKLKSINNPSKDDKDKDNKK